MDCFHSHDLGIGNKLCLDSMKQRSHLERHDSRGGRLACEHGCKDAHVCMQDSHNQLFHSGDSSTSGHPGAREDGEGGAPPHFRIADCDSRKITNWWGFSSSNKNRDQQDNQPPFPLHVNPSSSEPLATHHVHEQTYFVHLNGVSGNLPRSS